MAKIITFSEETSNIVDALNKRFREEGLAKGRIPNTRPKSAMLFLSYDSYNITDDVTPDDSYCRFTIEILTAMFPNIDIRLVGEEGISVDGHVLDGVSALPSEEYKKVVRTHKGYLDNNHRGYIEVIMLDIFNHYKGNDEKLPPKWYEWFYNK